MALPNHANTESWAFWGVAESAANVVSLVYVRDSQTIARTRVPDGVTTVLASFSNLSDMACITVLPLQNRWYFHHESGSQFGGSIETIGYAEASFAFSLTNPPGIITHPLSRSVKSGTNVSFTVLAQSTSPLSYQWRKNGTNLFDDGRIGGAASAALAISSLVEADSGLYSVLVTNAYGSVISSNAVLLVNPLDHFEWSVIPNPRAVGVPFGASITAKDNFNATVVSFSGNVLLRAGMNGGQTTNAILGNLIHASSGSGTYTLAFGFTPGTNLVITQVRSYSGTKVSIWRDDGTLLASQVVNGVPGTWTETPLASPLALDAGLTYRVGFYTGSSGAYYSRPDRTNGFPHGTMVSGYYFLSSDGFPSGYSGGNQTVYLVDLLYTVGTSQSTPMTPSISGAFTNGVWSGLVTMQQTGTNVVLHADDGSGHTGLSNPFEVGLQDDISITITDSPDPVSINNPVTYTLNVLNTGPSLATGLIITNQLPSSSAFISATGSQGVCTQVGNLVVCDLGTLGANTNAVVSIVVTPNVSGTWLTNRATVYRAEADPFAGNNTASAITSVTPPEISIADSALAEGNLGTTSMVFSVTLGSVSDRNVTVNYSTGGGTANSGIDFIFTSGVLVFPAGTTNALILVPIKGDIVIEQDETFFVLLSAPTNGVLSRSTAMGTILNDDGLPGEVYSLQWSAVGTPQNVAEPFDVNLSVRDAFGIPVTNFAGPLNLSGFLSGTNTIPVTPSVAWNFTNGFWSGSIVVAQRATNLMLRADDGNGHVGISTAFHVIASNQPPFIVLQPTNTSGYLGGSASMQVNVYGPGPMTYEWRLNGVEVPGQTNVILQLNQLRLGQAGSYSVSVSNIYGATSSSKASLSLFPVAAWGAGTNHNGNSFNHGQSVVPAGLTNVVGLAGGLYHSVAVGVDGKVSAWGPTNFSGQVQGVNYGQTLVPPLGSVVAVAAGGYHSLALRGDGTLAAWGAGTNNNGQVNSYGQSLIPNAASNIVGIAAGDLHSVALRRDGRVLVWGFNPYGQTNVPVAATSNVIAVASRGNHVLALKADGTLVHWGFNTTLPGAISNIVAIAAGVNHCLALKNDGTVISWGSQASIPFGLSNVVEIAAGSDHSVALRSDGRVVTWGVTNTYGRFFIPSGISNFTGLAAGAYHSLGFLGEGSPQIKYPPVNRVVSLGAATSFSVLAAGPQLRYQWQHNGTNLPNATNFIYSLFGTQASQAGNYRVVLTNAFGSVTSSVASLTVLTPLATSLDASGLFWATSGNAAWFGQTAIAHDGVDAAQSGTISNSQQTVLQTSVTGPGSVTFWWKVSSEEYFDFLNFSIDGALQDGISGEVDWQPRTFPLGSGTKILRWTYVKDSGVNAGFDSAWLDQVVVVTNPPVITLHPGNQTNFQNGTVQFSMTVIGAPPLSYQWMKGSSNLPGATGSALILANLARRDSGVYSAMVSNPGGSTPSSNAFLRVYVPQQLKSAGWQPDGSFLLFSGDKDGGMLGSDDLANFEVQASTNLSDWMVLPADVTFTNGSFLFRDRDSTNHPLRFYRVMEH
ncbi:MAG: immunoglobulin domain-containing protein [Akkermansiaceae bacterium]|nr:immunoglobulin domain-containing protein [Verrucomicrobiales bacterium]